MAQTPEHARGPVHLSPKVLVIVWIALLGLTALTVGIASLELGRLSIVAVLLIAGIKSSLVAGWFMHLRYERVRLYLAMLIITLLIIGVLLWLTFTDVGVRYQGGA
jgi:cytochrome c oxidase subunit 4